MIKLAFCMCAVEPLFAHISNKQVLGFWSQVLAYERINTICTLEREKLYRKFFPVLTLSLLEQPKVANQKCPVFPKSGQI